MSQRLEELREEIVRKTREFQRLRQSESPKFDPRNPRVPVSGKMLDEEDLANLVDSSLDLWLTSGRFCDKFEEMLARFFGLKHAAMANSGSSANLLALSALTSDSLGSSKLSPGDEVITAATAFPTTVNPIFQNGLVPVFLDVELATYNIDLSRIEEAIGERTKAVMVAHTLGNPFDAEKLSKLCKERGIFLIEDCCDAFGARLNGRLLGTFGDFATLSFYPAHHITTGEGGAVLTDNPLLNRLAVSFRDWGRDCWCKPCFFLVIVCFNSII